MRHGSRWGRSRLLAAGAVAAALLVGPRAALHPARADGGVFGPDVASFQHPGGAGIDWRAVAGSGAAFALVKATEGTGYVNPYFAGDWAGIRGAGLIRGAYSFARPGLPLSSAADQAATFVRTLGTTRETGDLAPILDLEVTGGLSAGQLVSWTHLWLDTVAGLTGRTPIIYTGQYFWRDATGGDTSFRGYPLWLAAYQNTAPQAPLAGGWPGWTLWQYTDNAAIPGISGGVDTSVFCCSRGTLAALADGRSTPIAAKYAATGGPSGPLGLPQAPEVAVPGGWQQSYQHGVITYGRRVGAHVLTGAVLARWQSDGGARGVLGLPVTDLATVPGGHVTAFLGGRIYLGAAGAHTLTGALLHEWLRRGGPHGPGLPSTEASAAGPGAVQQSFRSADVFGSAGHGFYSVHGEILARYRQVGGPTGVLGLPLTDETAVLGGAESTFSGGVIRLVAALHAAIVL